MFIKELTIKNFRKFEELNLNEFKNINILKGRNGSGKTTVLEAIYFLSFGRTFSNFNPSSLIKRETDYFFLSTKFLKSEEVKEIDLLFSPSKKEIKLNGIKEKGLSKLIGNLRSFVLNHETINILKGFPKARRGFLNMVISSINKDYLNNLYKYHAILKRKNSYLKSPFKKPPDFEFLDFLNSNLSSYSLKIQAQRSEFLGWLSSNIKDLRAQNEIFKNRWEIKINYEKSKISAEDFKNITPLEISKKVSLIGSHLDDFSIFVDGINSKDFLSLGELKIMSLLLNFSGIEYIKEKTSEYPIILLDDFEEDIDIFNFKELLSYVKKFNQVFISTFSLQNFESEFLENSNIIYLNNG